MRALRFWWIFNGLLALGVVGMLTLRVRTLIALQHERDALARETGTLSALRAQHRQLAAEAPSSAELAKRREEQRAAEHLRRELSELRERIQRRLDAARAPGVANRAPLPAPPAELPAARGPASWRDVGRGSPSAAIETTLWAAQEGDVQRLAEGLLLGPAGASQARALLQRLPASLRADITTPEQLVALLMAGQPPQEQMVVPEQGEETAGDKGARRVVTLVRPDGEQRKASVVTVKVDDHWKLVVPDPVVGTYLQAVTGPAPTSPPKPR
jgi:hypothetical protein